MFCETFYQFPRPSKIVRDGTRPGRAWHNTRVQVKNVPSTNFGRTERHRQTACQVKPRNDSAPHTQNFFSCWVLIPKFSLRPTFQAVPDSGQCVGRGDGWCGGSEGDLYTYSEQLSKLRLNRLSPVHVAVRGQTRRLCGYWTEVLLSFLSPSFLASPLWLGTTAELERPRKGWVLIFGDPGPEPRPVTLRLTPPTVRVGTLREREGWKC